MRYSGFNVLICLFVKTTFRSDVGLTTVSYKAVCVLWRSSKIKHSTPFCAEVKNFPLYVRLAVQGRLYLCFIMLDMLCWYKSYNRYVMLWTELTVVYDIKEFSYMFRQVA